MVKTALLSHSHGKKPDKKKKQLSAWLGLALMVHRGDKMKARQEPTVATQHQNHTSFTVEVVGLSALWSPSPSIRMGCGIVQLLPLVHEHPALGASTVANTGRRLLV